MNFKVLPESTVLEPVHACLSVDEVLRSIAMELVESGARATAVALASCCKSLEDPLLDTLWETQDRLLPLLKTFPGDVWKVEEGKFTFGRIPTKLEWCRFGKYARRMKELEVNLSRDAMGPEVLSALQLRAGNDPLLPRLWSFGCEGATESFIPFIPLFLSHQIININIGFSGNSPIVMVASTIARFWTWCPNIQRIELTRLPESPVITEAASEMVLASNRDTLLSLFVNSPLTEEAQEVLYKLPNLRHLWAVLRATPPPQVTLSNLTTISVIFNHESGWSQLFHGAKLRKLESVRLVPSPSAQIGGSLEEFESAAASVQNTLSEFRFRTAQSWSPNYPSILAFKRLKVLEIDFSCHNGCSSRVKDDIVISIAKAMPRLEILRLGQATCSNPIGATFKSFVALAHCCPQLSRLRIHLQLIPLAETLDGIEQPFSSKPKCAAAIPRTDCALTELQVGEASIPPGAPLAIALALVRLFPRLRNIDYANPQWKFVAETITLSKVTGDLIHYTRSALDV